MSGIYSAPLLGVAYCLVPPRLTDVCYSTSVSGHNNIYQLQPRQRDGHLDAANQGASNGHIL